jgi:general secretion pathway protein K
MKMFQRAGATKPVRQQGFVLLVVLWVLTSAVILVASFNAAARSGAASAGSEIGVTKSEALLDAGLEIAAAHLIDQDEKRRWPGNGATHRVVFADTDLTITATDANGLVDLNKSDEKLLRAFFQKFTNSTAKAAQYTNAILHAREAVSGDKKTEVSDTVTGALQGAPASRLAFIDVWQLGRSKEIPRDVFDQVAPFLTVYSRDGTIDPVAAPTRVLESIPNLNRADIEKLKYADKTALADLMQKAQSYLTDQRGPAYLVTVRAHRPEDSYSVARTFVIVPGLDPLAPYRLLAKWPATSTAAEKTR